jgi:hypothetical protein
VDTGFPKRSCSNKKIERDDDSKKRHRALVGYSGGFGWAVFGQALRDVGDPISRQHLGFVGLVSTLALPDLLGSALFRSFAIFGSDSFRVDQLLSKGRFTKNQCCDGAQVPK